MTALLLIALLALALVVAELLRFHFWFARSTDGAAYFGLPSAGRRAFSDEMRRRARFPAAVWGIFCKLPFNKPPSPPRRAGIGAPPHCDRAGFDRALRYAGAEGDVFVVTQMKCGTTWMLQLAYEVAMRGRGDLSDEGQRHIHAVCPWIESTWAVPMEEAPRLGDRRLRVIKSHMPVQLLPVRPQARYLVVTRHPVPCFGSCVDFVGMLAGPVAGTRADMLDWFCSTRMWWGPWADHVEGWWKASLQHPNVLFVHFEEMTADLPGVVDRVARFLDVELTPAERDEVIRKSRFDYMKEHEERFSMSPPTLFAPDGEFLKKGTKRKDTDEGGGERERIVAYCRERLRDGEYAKDCFYPDLRARG
jgi:aryl sulfotransferase